MFAGLSSTLELQVDRLSVEERRRALLKAERFVRELGVPADEAMARALFELDGGESRPFRRTGLRWDE